MTEWSATTARTARRAHVCGSCTARIARGDRYLEHRAPPSHTYVGGTSWSRIVECAECAARCGRPIEGAVGPVAL
jgi:hypothetical protein